ncbi:MAG: 50S ribosomal protein L18 [Myxococcota bacterium]
MKNQENKRFRRKRRIRRKISGTAERPRLSVFRSSKNIYAQLIDDVAGVTLASASTLDPELRERISDMEKSEAATEVGKLVASRAKEKGQRRADHAPRRPPPPRRHPDLHPRGPHYRDPRPPRATER